MIQFQLNLSVNQIACLRAIAEITDGGATSLSLPSMWFAGTRLLFAEKLISHYRENGTEKGWQITEKGRLVLRLIEMDIADAADSISYRAKKIADKSKPILEVTKP